MTPASPTSGPPIRGLSRGAVAGMFALLAGWVLFLRWPTFGALLWNLDEGIHAAIARTLLHGGVLYRDGVDQRTPLTYYFVAAVFRLFGENNLWAVRAAASLVIAATAGGLFLLGRRTRDASAGAWAAVIYCALTTSLFYFGDANNGVNTEWFVALFTTWGSWWFWRTMPEPGLAASVGTGAIFSLAILSKQPAVFDSLVPALTLGYLGSTGRLAPARAVRAGLGLLLGVVAAATAVAAYFALHGAFGAMVFYTATYNLLYYGPGIPAARHLLAAFVPFVRLGQHYPFVLAALLAGAICLLLRLAQRRPEGEERAGQPWSFYLLAWGAASLAGAAASGRRFEHYFIQGLPALSLMAGWLLAGAGARIRRPPAAAGRTPRKFAGAALAALLVGATGLNVSLGPLLHRGRDEQPRYAAEACSKFMRTLTTPAERIFVWGFNPDIYLYANRRPASRFVYCSFQTGLIPWVNIAPGEDTSATVVPGSMGTLLADLEARRPTFLVDASADPGRHFANYPIRKFPPLAAFVTADYLEAESQQFVPQGFRLYLIKDRARRVPVPLDGGERGRPLAPSIFGPAMVGPIATGILVKGEDPDGRLQRLELRVGDRVVDSVSFQPTRKLTVQFEVPFDRLGAGQYRLIARAVCANGATRDSSPTLISCAASAVPPSQLAAYGLPCVTTTLPPLTVRSPFPPMVDQEDGHRVIFVHAPSLLSFDLPIDARRVAGGFGIRPGAWAPDNRFPTDGAEFFVELVSAAEERQVLFHRWLQPRDHPADRPMQFFSVAIPPHPPGGRLEFVITPGPYNNNASDWTFWSDLQAGFSH